MQENLFLRLSDEELDAALTEYRNIVEKTGTIPEDGAIAPYRDAYCENNPAGLVVMTTDLLYAGAYRWLAGRKAWGELG